MTNDKIQNKSQLPNPKEELGFWIWDFIGVWGFGFGIFMLRLLSIFLLLILFNGCGIKADPVPLAKMVPKRIKDLRAIAREDGVILLWTAPRENADGSELLDLAGFKVWRKDLSHNNGDFVLISKIKLERTHSLSIRGKLIMDKDTDLVPGRKYLYRVGAYNRNNFEGMSSDPFMVSFAFPPGPPTNILAVPENEMASISWNFPNTFMDGFPVKEPLAYNVYITTKSGVYKLNPVNQEPIVGNSYQSFGLKNGQKYFFIIRPLRYVDGTLIEGPPSEEVAVIPSDIIAPAAPKGLVAVQVESGIILKWDGNPEPDVIGYYVYRKKKKDYKKINTEPIRGTSYLDRAVEKDTVYTYYITALDSAPRPNESKPSQRVRIKYEKI